VIATLCRSDDGSASVFVLSCDLTLTASFGFDVERCGSHIVFDRILQEGNKKVCPWPHYKISGTIASLVKNESSFSALNLENGEQETQRVLRQFAYLYT